MQMEKHLSKGEVVVLSEDSPPVTSGVGLSVDLDELAKAQKWALKTFDNLGVPAEVYFELVDLPYETHSVGYRGALIAYAVIDIGIPLSVSESDWKSEWVDKEKTRITQSLLDCGPFMYTESTIMAWENIRDLNALPKYITPSTLVSLKSIHQYISGGMGIAERLLPMALMGCWASVIGDPTLGFSR